MRWIINNSSSDTLLPQWEETGMAVQLQAVSIYFLATDFHHAIFVQCSSAFGCCLSDAFICWYMCVICELARGLQSSKGLLFSTCHSLTNVHCSGKGWFVWMSEVALMFGGEGVLFSDIVLLVDSRRWAFLSSQCSRHCVLLLLTLSGCHDDGQSRDWIAVMWLLCSKLVSNWLKCFYPAGNDKQGVTEAKWHWLFSLCEC